MNEFELLKKEVEELKRWKASLESSNTIPLEIDQAFRDRLSGGNLAVVGLLAVANGGTGVATITGILKGNGTSALTAITQYPGVFVCYAADSSGGSTTRKLTFTDGILTAIT